VFPCTGPLDAQAFKISIQFVCTVKEKYRETHTGRKLGRTTKMEQFGTLKVFH
jgi:hypothetical protein